MHKFGINYSCVGVVLFTCVYLGNAFMNITAINQIYRLRREYLKVALNQDFAYFDVHQTTDFASKMADDVIKLEEGIGDKVPSFIYSVTTAIGCICMAVFKGWKLALLCLITTPVTFALVGLTGRIADRLYKKEAIQTGHASAIAHEVISSIRTVYAFNGQKKELERYTKPLAKAKKIYIKKALGNLGLVGSLVRSFGVARGAGAQIYRLLDSVPTINPLLDRGLKPLSAEGVIEFKNVDFYYPSRPDVPILKGVSLSVKHGYSVALVGHSGCGKSTIIQLISRYYDVCNGSVCLDGNDVRTLSVVWLRSQIGLVGQEPVLFNTTVRENIRYGREDATYEDIEAAAKQANAHHFIMKLPKGYDTLVGELGASLSGGQKQRIAIARALVRQPRLLLLDEATSALDTASEAKVQIALEKAAKGRTTIVVAHRLSTIRHANMIYVMNSGELVESGTHEELMAKHGHYYDMVGLQEPMNIPSTDDVLTREDSTLSEAYVMDNLSKTVLQMSSDDDEAKVANVSFWRVLALKSKEWKWMVAGTVCSMFVGFTMPLFIVLFGDLFGSMSNPDTKVLMSKVDTVSAMCVIIGLVMGIAHLIEAVSFAISGANLTEKLRLRMFEHILKQDVMFFDEKANSTGALCAKLSAEASYVQSATGQRIGICFQGLGSIGLALVLAMLYEYRVGLLALAFLPVIFIIIYYQSKSASKESFGNAKALENSTKIALEAVGNIRTVVSLGLEKWFVSEYVRALTPTLKIAHRNAHCRGLVSGLSRSLFNFVNSAALTYGGHLIVTEGVRYEHILVTTQSLQMASGQAQNAFTFAPEFQKGIAAASRIIALLNMRATILDPEVPAVAPFVDSGKTVALVGRSGCGKSTVIELLQRFYDPSAGCIYLDEISLANVRMSEVRSSFGLVSQEPVLFDYSIEENIAYGDYVRSPSHYDVVEAAKLANIHDFVISLPLGYETNIGPKGMQLSGGQKQRVAIARALIRKPKILLLDEATSALDTESEKVVQAALDAASASCTCLVIAHRLSTVRDAHLICVVSGGVVAESGTHHELLDLRGLYYRLHSNN
ncbi:unnamed protein product [Arctia plantaginis]|uniref:ABC-type xenobiotic transporter n=1 Tax=Arctia plantaginis TaxID=874455 RepID=A0A8S1BQZ8_ARCPL|nr:unnamed protein product [Arctia plantaginis]